MPVPVPLWPPTGRITMESENGARVLRLVGDIDHAAIEAYETYHSALHTPP
jgi:hypothetical protein